MDCEGLANSKFKVTKLKVQSSKYKDPKPKTKSNDSYFVQSKFSQNRMDRFQLRRDVSTRRGRGIGTCNCTADMRWPIGKNQNAIRELGRFLDIVRYQNHRARAFFKHADQLPAQTQPRQIIE